MMTGKGVVYKHAFITQKLVHSFLHEDDEGTSVCIVFSFFLAFYSWYIHFDAVKTLLINTSAVPFCAVIREM